MHQMSRCSLGINHSSVRCRNNFNHLSTSVPKNLSVGLMASCSASCPISAALRDCQIIGHPTCLCALTNGSHLIKKPSVPRAAAKRPMPSGALPHPQRLSFSFLLHISFLNLSRRKNKHGAAPQLPPVVNDKTVARLTFWNRVCTLLYRKSDQS